jgi:hypothetical protein
MEQEFHHGDSDDFISFSLTEAPLPSFEVKSLFNVLQYQFSQNHFKLLEACLVLISILNAVSLILWQYKNVTLFHQRTAPYNSLLRKSSEYPDDWDLEKKSRNAKLVHHFLFDHTDHDNNARRRI